MEQFLNPEIKSFILSYQELFSPNSVCICNGSDEEYDRMIQLMIESGTAERLANNNILVRSDPQDVARVEDRTFICSVKEEDAGPTNNWVEPSEMKDKLNGLMSGAMMGRVMYVIPFCMGPLGSDYSYYGIQLTDSPYVVANMKKMTRMGQKALDLMNEYGNFVRCVHTVAYPLSEGVKDVPWPCREDKYIAHFPETREILSFGSGYGGNALLGKKCFALRIASCIAKDEGWLAEHMLIIKITDPNEVTRTVAAAFPSACGKTNLAMMQPSLAGWKVEVIGDDIAWMKSNDKGELYAINPEAGFFGVAPGTSKKTNPNAMNTIRQNTIFTNTGSEDGKPIWEGIDSFAHFKNIITWKKVLHDGSDKVAHPNARFTVSANECPVLSNDFNNLKGVKIDAILVGGRRDEIIPLVFQTFDAQEGVLIGASLTSEMTAAAKGTVGKVRRDPFAMLPFCGYNMGDYFKHWLAMSERLPAIFHVNWFRKDKDGNFMWPGFGENIRVLEWIFGRLKGEYEGKKTPIGTVPKVEEFNVKGLDEKYSKQLSELFKVDTDAYMEFFEELESYFQSLDFKGRFPSEFNDLINQFKNRLANANSSPKSL